jgi:SAM-dependent methyltransferase
MAEGDESGLDTYGELWADLYDDEFAWMVPPHEQLAVLAELANGGEALELGIGTGRIALPLAARGVKVTGLDASPAMVGRLRAKPAGMDIPVTIGDMAEIPVDGPFELVYVVFNTIFGLLTQDAQVSSFRNVARVLSGTGRFCVECFVPDVARFDRGQTVRATRVKFDQVRLDASRHNPITQRVDTTVVRIGSGGVDLRPIRLRYAWPSELDLMAQLAGLRLEHRWSDWERRPFTSQSGTHISVYQAN